MKQGVFNTKMSVMVFGPKASSGSEPVILYVMEQEKCGNTTNIFGIPTPVCSDFLDKKFNQRKINLTTSLKGDVYSPSITVAESVLVRRKTNNDKSDSYFFMLPVTSSKQSKTTIENTENGKVTEHKGSSHKATLGEVIKIYNGETQRETILGMGVEPGEWRDPLRDAMDRMAVAPRFHPEDDQEYDLYA